ncbi:hypothetical protein DYB37_005336 [Aphanomyces astaci]|uniref:Phosphodiesterase n=2 Tax=Aphanomyces astaci TaxID=112090 RepID=A0A3R7BBV0_APHAT|nr:hypothetical protein DYB35_003573 [Aphanomyces astaci]RHZ24417.1 hypothetical protein DYB37_005336 [Aphanomyces astaci]
MNVSVKSPRASAKPGARSVVPSDSLPSRRSVVELPPNARRNFRQRHRAAKALDQYSQLKVYQDEFDLVDLVVSSVLTVELLLRLFGFGFVMLLSFWNCFDAVVVVGTLVLSLWSFTSANGTGAALATLLRMRPILRIFRIVVVFERIKQRSAALKHAHRGSTLQTPIETVLGTLYELRYQPSIKPSVQNEIDYAIYCIKNNKLYDAGEHMLNGQNIDKDTQDWLRDGLLRKNDASAVTPSPAATDVGGGDDGKAGRPGGGGIGSLRKENSGITDELFPLTESARSHFNDLMTTVADWDFDVFRLQGNALTHMGYFLLRDLVEEHLLLDAHTLAVFLIEIQQGYIMVNPYHNAMHAADVMQTSNYFSTRNTISPFLRPLDRTLVLLAACIHDYKHDGFNNGFHIASGTDGSELAIRYNDTAVLENFHVAQAFLTMKSAGCMLFAKLNLDDYKYDTSSLNVHKMLMKMIIHTSDVSNPAKTRMTMLRWTDRVVDEFFGQGDKEKTLGLVVSPFMDRTTLALKKMQLGFADFVVSPLFHVWSNISDQVQADGYSTLLDNREWWNQREDNFKHSQIKGVVKDLQQDANVASGLLSHKTSGGSSRGLSMVREGDGGTRAPVSQTDSDGGGSHKLELVVKETKETNKGGGEGGPTTATTP